MAGRIWGTLASAIGAAGTGEHIDRLIDLIGAETPHDVVTVTRYSASHVPEFVKHRQFSDAMARRYLQDYYVYDPFYALWRRDPRPRGVALRRLVELLKNR